MIFEFESAGLSQQCLPPPRWSCRSSINQYGVAQARPQTNHVSNFCFHLRQVLVLTALLTTVRAIIVQQAPVTYSLAGGYPQQFLPQDPGIIYRYGTPNHIPYYKPSQQTQSKHGPGSQYAAGFPTVHHPAEYTFASPPVRHAEPINYPVPPAPVKEDVKEPPEADFLQTYPAGTTIAFSTPEVTQSGLLGVAYSPANVVSSMTFSNSYGVAYGY